MTLESARLRVRRSQAATLAIVLGCLLAVFVPALAAAAWNSQSQSSDSDKSSDAKKNSDEPPTVKLKIEITDPHDKPVGSASVYVRFSQSGGPFHKDKLAELNLKTNDDGTVKVPDIPQGKIMIQVIAKGLHTYGKWYDINKSEDTIQIKLENPPHWY